MKLGLFSILAISVTSLQLYGGYGNNVVSQRSQQHVICEQIVNNVVKGTALVTGNCPSGWTTVSTNG